MRAGEATHGPSALPRLGEAPAMLAWLLRGSAGRPFAAAPSPQAEQALAEFLLTTRLAAEVTALSSRLAESGLAAAVRRSFAVERARIAHVAAIREATVKRLGEVLSGAGLQAMLYKGEAIVRLTHGDFSRRPMTDIDLIVAPEALQATSVALRAAGFVASHETAMHDVLLDAASRGTGHPRGVAVEVHSDVMDPPHPFALGLPNLLLRGSPSEHPGLLLPRPVDALFLHAFHLLFHEQDVRKGFLRLRDVALLALAAEQREGAAVAREELFELGRAAGLLDALSLVGQRARAWAGGPDWLGELPRGELRGRRRLALNLIRRELDEGLTRASLASNRTFSRRLAAALWQPGWSGTLRALCGSLVGEGSLARRLRRVPRLLWRYLRAAKGSKS